MRSLLDVNVLIALLDANHVFHQRAHTWWGHNMKSGWASSALTENGAIRIMSQPAYRPSLPLLPLQIIRALEEFAQATDHQFWPDDLSIRDQTRFEHNHIHGPKQVTDLYLLGLAVGRGGRLVTFDSGIAISTVKGASRSHLCVI